MASLKSILPNAQLDEKFFFVSVKSIDPLQVVILVVIHTRAIGDGVEHVLDNWADEAHTFDGIACKAHAGAILLHAGCLLVDRNVGETSRDETLCDDQTNYT